MARSAEERKNTTVAISGHFWDIKKEFATSDLKKFRLKLQHFLYFEILFK
jgi:hypothetical protein